MKQFAVIVKLLFGLVMLSACLYPGNETQSRMPVEEQVKQVQHAVNEYRNDHDGLLPIKDRHHETDPFLKYAVEFQKLVPRYLHEIPDNAYEKGGFHQYVIIETEKNPEVKLADLRIADKIQELHARIKRQTYPPFQKKISHNVYTLDFSKLGYKEEPVVESPFTGQNLPLVISGEGNIYVDYAADLYQQMKKKSNTYYRNEDLRMLLAEDSLFVPAFSLPYTADDSGEPVFMDKK